MARHNGPWTTDYFNMDGQSGNMLNQIDRSLFDFMDDLTNLQNGDLYEINEVIQHAEGQSCKLFSNNQFNHKKCSSEKIDFSKSDNFVNFEEKIEIFTKLIWNL